MFHHIQGELTLLKPTLAVIEAAGVGYEVEIPISTYEKLRKSGLENVRLLVHLHVREDLHRLYGFATEGERDLFRLLLTVGGVGPKVGLNILSGSTVEDVRHAVATGDDRPLTRIKGIGKKMAARLIVELKERIDELPAETTRMEPRDPSDEHDAIMALVSLGFTAAESQRAIQEAARELGQAAKAEDLVRVGLRHAT